MLKNEVRILELNNNNKEVQIGNMKKTLFQQYIRIPVPMILYVVEFQSYNT